VMIAVVMFSTSTRQTAAPRLYEGINLPVADAADPGEPSPETTLEVPLVWGDNVSLFRERAVGKINGWNRISAEDRERFDEDHAYRPFIIAADRRLRYRVLYMAALAGRDGGFVIHKFACRRSEGGDIGYLTLELPKACGPWYTSDNNPGMVLSVFPEGEKVRYRIEEMPVSALLSVQVIMQDSEAVAEPKVFDAPQPIITANSLDELGAIIRTRVAKAPEFGCKIKCYEGFSVQQFVDVYNAVLKAGCYRVLLAIPLDKKKQERP